MRLPFLTFVFLSSLINSLVFGQCAVNVSIDEGASISMCANALETLNASGGFVSYSWSGPQSGSGQTFTPSLSGNYTVDATDGVGCVSSASINVTVNPVPVDAIASSAGTSICPGSGGTTLSLSGAYMLYDWGGGVTTATYQVNDGGSYSVSVADANGCIGIFSITISEPDFAVTSSAGVACLGASVALTASGGTSYVWSTGETSETIVVSPASTTNYSVTISDGTCFEVFTVPVSIGEQQEYEMPDTIYIALGEVYYMLGPEGYETYQWYPTDQIGDSTGAGVYITGSESFTLFVEATHSAGCTITDQVVVIVVDLTIPTGFSPNGDMVNDSFMVPELADLPGELTVWNRWGDKVYQSDHYQNDWAGTCETDFCLGNAMLPEGTYFYLIDVEEITFKGYFTLKR